MESVIALAHPRAELAIHLLAQLHEATLLAALGCGAASRCGQRCPTRGECSPVLVWALARGQGRPRRLKQPLQVLRRIAFPAGAKADCDPLPRELFGLRMVDGAQGSLCEQVANVRSRAIVTERESGRSAELQAGWCSRVAQLPLLKRHQVAHEDGPALLEEGVEGLPVGHDLGKGPVVKPARLTKHEDQPFVEDARQAVLAVVLLEEEAEEVGRLTDHFGGQLVDVAEEEILRRVVSQHPGCVLCLSEVEDVESAAIQRLHNRKTQVREQVAQAEPQLPARLQEVKGKVIQIAARRPQHDHQVGQLAPVPTPPVLGLVCESEGEGILERDDLEAPLPQSRRHAFFREQTVRVSHKGQPRDTRRELSEYLLSPATHRQLLPPAPVPRKSSPG